MRMNLMNAAACACALLLWAASASISTAFADVPPPLDTAYPGTLELRVDATDLDHRVFRVREEIPVRPGPLTLLYPHWVPGGHSPRGPLDKMAGLLIRGNGQPIQWMRDPVEVAAFHLEVPAGVSTLSVEFEFLSPLDPAQGRRVMTPDMLNLQWNTVALYPAGHYASRIQVAPSVKLPPGWQFASALEVAAGETPNTVAADGTVRFKPVDFDTLVDSPIFAGRHFKRVALGDGNAPVHLNIVADEAADLAITPQQLKVHQRPGGAGAQAVRLAALRPLRLPARVDRPARRHRPGAPPFQRERRRPRLLHGLGPARAGARPARARVHAFVERQVPPPGGSRHAEFQRADARRPALGLRGPDPVLGRRAGGAFGPVERRTGARRAGRWSPRPTPTTGPASTGATCRTPPAIRSSRSAGHCRTAAGR